MGFWSPSWYSWGWVWVRTHQWCQLTKDFFLTAPALQLSRPKCGYWNEDSQSQSNNKPLTVMPSYGSGENLFWRSWTQGQCLEVLRQPFNKPTPVTATELHRLFYFKESGDSISPNSVYTAAFRSISVLASCPCIQSSLIIYVIATSFLLLPPAFVPSPSQSFCVLKRALNLVSMKQVRGTWRRGGEGVAEAHPCIGYFFSFPDRGKAYFALYFKGTQLMILGKACMSGIVAGDGSSWSH